MFFSHVNTLRWLGQLRHVFFLHVDALRWLGHLRHMFFVKHDLCEKRVLSRERRPCVVDHRDRDRRQALDSCLFESIPYLLKASKRLCPIIGYTSFLCAKIVRIFMKATILTCTYYYTTLAAKCIHRHELPLLSVCL